MPNFLQYEDSPYLYAHKNDSINWFAWGEDAFEKAKQEHKIIFLSIGYSTCHWCHVMHKEVFENKDIAEFLNKYFICIKVDKEERPDIDKYYQKAYQALTNKPGGWPTSIFSTPNNLPFFAATYIPADSKNNMAGFKQLMRAIVRKFFTDQTLYDSSKKLQEELLQEKKTIKSKELDLKIKDKFVEQCKSTFEPIYGGFTLAPKFPQVATLHALITLYELEKADELFEMITDTLDNMISGGLYDLVDGGFCRYSTDAEWLVPHFEKMTYDNGLLCALYQRASRVFQKARYLEVSKEIAEFMSSFMMQEGCFYSASDADTHEIEGEYFVYAYGEVISAIKNAGYNSHEAKRMAMRLTVSKEGNFKGKNIIHFANIKKEPWFENLKESLRSFRKEREYPFTDKKIQTSWSSMMIRSMFLLSMHEEKYLHMAEFSLKKLLSMMYSNSKLMHSSLIFKEAKIEGYLEDYAYLGVALISAYEVTSKQEYLDIAQRLAESALELFYSCGEWKFSKGAFEASADAQDDSYPSSIAVILDLLLSLGTLVDDKYRSVVYECLLYCSAEFESKPIVYASMIEQLVRYEKEDRVLKAPYESSYKEILELYKYPFMHIKYHKEKYFELCSNSSCLEKSFTLPTRDSISS